MERNPAAEAFLPGGATRLLGVLGWPVAHSLSPAMHNLWLRNLGMDALYLPLPVAADDFTATVQALQRLGFVGANVTLPHKEAAFRLASVRTERAQRAGSVNTLHFRDGEIIGDSTDGVGLVAALDAGGTGWRDGPVFFLGAGGAARSMLQALIDCGCRRITLCNRTRSRAETLAGLLDGVPSLCPWEERNQGIRGARLVINSTSLGMTGQAEPDLDFGRMDPAGTVFDAVYRPIRTGLLQRAEESGLKTIPGLGMLIGQGQHAFERWFGILPAAGPWLQEHLARLAEGSDAQDRGRIGA